MDKCGTPAGPAAALSLYKYLSLFLSRPSAGLSRRSTSLSFRLSHVDCWFIPPLAINKASSLRTFDISRKEMGSAGIDFISWGDRRRRAGCNHTSLPPIAITTSCTHPTMEQGRYWWVRQVWAADLVCLREVWRGGRRPWPWSIMMVMVEDDTSSSGNT